ncbi:MAG: hypothetical protein LRY67_06430 [Gammaproteobacteria bacterium]|nr:hypothetical protein [Gammaproteobacteria bacterium]MCD8525345.1 hypothetical protein [Gammaproteobacteria bacterium]MCD8543131.1 hypothetical protein [Gammaproteobacteria bacterium]MCD8573883.1 hypothetical protein [Gammaproteobacteria bacterium]
MLEKDPKHYTTLDMLPVIQDRVINAIDASKNAFQLLNDDSHLLPHDLWDEEQCLKDHEIQIEQLLILKEQCEFWRKNSYLTPVQKIELLYLEDSLTECAKISQQVIFNLQEKLK